MRAHVDHNKWVLCAFSTEQFRSQRWLIGSSPKSSSCPPELKKVLSVTEEAQILHFKLTVQCFLENGRRLRVSARPRVRWSPAAFEAHCDYACVMASVLREARQLASFNPEKEMAILKAFTQKFLGFNAFPQCMDGLNLQILGFMFFVQSICLLRDYFNSTIRYWKSCGDGVIGFTLW